MRRFRRALFAISLVLLIALSVFTLSGLEALSKMLQKALDTSGSNAEAGDFAGAYGHQSIWVSSVELNQSQQDGGFLGAPSIEDYGPVSAGYPVTGTTQKSPCEVHRNAFSTGYSTYFVDGGSIQATIDSSNPGDTINVYAGVYYEHIVIWKFNLTLIGENAQSTIIDGQGWGDVVEILNSSIRLSGFSIRNGDNGVKIEGIHASNNTVSGNQIFANKNGVYLLDTSSNTITGNWIVSNFQVGVGVDGESGNRVYNNYISNKINAYDTNIGQAWNKTFGGTDLEWANSVIQTSDGGYALAGVKHSSVTGNNFWLVKTNSVGNQLWNATYTRSIDDEAYRVVQTSDGGYALAGYTLVDPYRYFWLVRTDANGVQLWNKTYGGTHDVAVAYSVVQTADGGFTMAGQTAAYGAGGYDFWLVKTDANGNELWDHTYGRTGDETARSMAQTRDGGYALVGYTSSFGGVHFWLVKTDSTGNEMWNKTYGGSGVGSGILCHPDH